MFIRQKKNKSGSISIHILEKSNGKNKLIKSIGFAYEKNDVQILIEKAKQEILKAKGQRSLFVFDEDILIESFISELSNAQVRTIDPELVFGIYFIEIKNNNQLSRKRFIKL